MTENRELPSGAWPGLTVVGPVTAGARSVVFEGRIGDRRVAVRAPKRSIPSLEWELSLLEALKAAGFTVPVPVPPAGGGRQVVGWSVTTWIEGRPPNGPEEWRAVADELRRLHRADRTMLRLGQRPGCHRVTELGAGRQATSGGREADAGAGRPEHRGAGRPEHRGAGRPVRSVDADLGSVPDHVVERCLVAFDRYLESQTALIHGDPGPDNIRITEDGRIGLIDWDEARVDVCDLDLANLGIPVLSGRRRTAAEHLAHAWETLNGWAVEPDYAAARFRQLPAPDSPAEPPTLTDGTVVLRARTVEDGPAQVAGEDSEIVQWLTGGEADLSRVEQHITNLQRVWAVGGLRHNFGIYVGSTLIGNVDLNLADLDLEIDEVNLSYAVFPQWRRRGHGGAAVRLAGDYLRRTEPSAAPTLKIDPANRASVALATGAGFRPTRTIADADGPLEVWHQPR